ncbi:hypothetical protein M2152_000692 [Microbacteriaceae bacterium SG_E_30_P1]|uniref:Uncharacterized protein n=1 Tax=Antiquaquibacter oligotrophicus TaxID=2880260 RepID=A0ABT6KKH7_9MICO|nr:hypothetical protein [Antiquaquibacter oligotrophicus]MDH6180510.1 hypothetical protein [Antiquaquibacter oligotrophicus]UDF13755.1 hypothetical protein LH407_02555 [Antiquaquibacter oligotrophicus]
MTILPEENTLGVVVGRAARRREADATRRVIRAAAPHRSSLGTGFIGIGATIVLALRALYGLGWFIGLWPTYPNPYLALAAWLVLAVTLVAGFVAIRVLGELPTWAFVLFVSGLGAAMSLDLAAIWELHDVGHYATAAVTAVMGLLVALTTRRTGDLIVATATLGAGLLSAMIVGTSWSADTASAQVTALAFAVLPSAIGIVLISGFRRLVQVELDRVLVQSTVSAPRFAVGMLASEELARLDLAAEELLDSVATGRVRLPLDPKSASVAASLATELRLHLIEGRRETWLFHAISESDLLGKSVTLVDRGSLAGLLDPAQRDGLLSTTWLLVADHSARSNSPRTVKLTIGPATSSVDTPSGKIRVPIVITTTGVPRNRVDPATWEAIGRVGNYSDSTENQSLRVDVNALVDNPADQ